MRFCLLCLFILLNFFSYSSKKHVPGINGLQNDSAVHKNNENVILHVKKATAPIKIDGLISEPDWETAEKILTQIKCPTVTRAWTWKDFCGACVRRSAIAGGS